MIDNNKNVVQSNRKMKQRWVILNDSRRNIRERYVLDESKTVRDYLSEYWIVFVLLVFFCVEI